MSSFAEALRLSSRRFGFSVTSVCPLRCAHCSVDAGPRAPDARLYSGAAVDRIAAQIADLARIGITSIDFTGGEPTLVLPFVARISAAAVSHGIDCGIVTAAKWAYSDAGVESMIRKLPDIANWDISTDIYHLPFVALDYVERAFRGLERAGRRPLIRIAHHEPLTAAEETLIFDVYQFAGRRIHFQPIGPVGRGADLVPAEPVDRHAVDRSPCPTTGPLARPDGVVAPCCAPLSHTELPAAFRIGHVLEDSLVEIVQRWRINPLLQTLRVWGFAPILRWCDELGVDPEHRLRSRQCDTCVELFRDLPLVEALFDRAAELTHRVKLGYVLKHDFDEPWIESSLVHEARQFQRQGVWPAYSTDELTSILTV